MNKYISKILIVVGSLGLSLIVSTSAFAEYPTIQDCANATWTKPVGCDAIMDKYYAGYYSNGYDYVSTTRNNSYNNNQPNQYNNQQVAYANYQPTPVPVVNNYYYKDESVTAKSTTTTTTKSSTSGSTKANTSTANTNKVNSDSDTANSEDVFSTDSNGLTALSFRGSGGFLPSSFWQWLIVIFLILGIVILARLISKSHRNDVHGAPAH